MVNQGMLSNAFEAVEKLNQEIYDIFRERNCGLESSLFELSTDGFSIAISFMGNNRLWFSSEDERKFNEKVNEYETIELYLRKEAQKIINQFGRIKLQLVFE